MNLINNFCAYRKLSNDCTSLNWRIQCNLCVLTAKNTFLSFPAKYLRSHLMLSSIHKLHFIAKRLTVIPLNSSSRFVPLYQLFCPFFTLSHSLFQIWNILIKPRRSLVSHLTYSSISLYNINFNIHYLRSPHSYMWSSLAATSVIVVVGGHQNRSSKILQSNQSRWIYILKILEHTHAHPEWKKNRELTEKPVGWCHRKKWPLNIRLSSNYLMEHIFTCFVSASACGRQNVCVFQRVDVLNFKRWFARAHSNVHLLLPLYHY